MKIITDAVRFPVTTAVGVILLILFGFIALAQIPVQLTPTVDEPTITVTTFWPGASPQEVEREIIDEQEEQLKSLEGLQRMESSSSLSWALFLALLVMLFSRFSSFFGSSCFTMLISIWSNSPFWVTMKFSIVTDTQTSGE